MTKPGANTAVNMQDAPTLAGVNHLKLPVSDLAARLTAGQGSARCADTDSMPNYSRRRGGLAKHWCSRCQTYEWVETCSNPRPFRQIGRRRAEALSGCPCLVTSVSALMVWSDHWPQARVA